MFAYIPYMDPMGIGLLTIYPSTIRFCGILQRQLLYPFTKLVHHAAFHKESQTNYFLGNGCTPLFLLDA